MTVRLATVDLVRRTAVVRVADDGRPELPHLLRGTLAALFDDRGWHVVVAFEREQPMSDALAAVLAQAQRWADERGCRLTVTLARDIPLVTSGARDA